MMANLTLKVEGMTCGHCKQSVERAVADIGGQAQVDLAAKQVSVTYDETAVKPDQIREAIEDQGFDVIS